MIRNSTEISYNERIARMRELLRETDYMLIGAGAGLSTTAGILYSGEPFEMAFADFIRRYGFTDLYTSSFYPFGTGEEKWAYWSRHVDYARLAPDALPLYRRLMKLVQDKPYFVVTTNVDGQFRKAGCDAERLFEVQGDYALIQGATGCDGHTYDASELFKRMVAEQRDCRIPTELVPRLRQFNPDAPKDEAMDIHVRKDMYFVEDEPWRQMQERYEAFLEEALGSSASGNPNKVVLLELGVGFNTPTIIRYPFERLAAQRRNTALVRINKDYPDAQLSGLDDFVSFDEDTSQILTDLAD